MAEVNGELDSALQNGIAGDFKQADPPTADLSIEMQNHRISARIDRRNFQHLISHDVLMQVECHESARQPMF